MTTALNDTTNVFDSFESGCEAYAAKPIDTDKFIKVMERLGLINKRGIRQIMHYPIIPFLKLFWLIF